MRTLLKVSIPVEQGNKAIVEGTLGRVIQETVERIKPEAAYFTVDGGKRTAFFVFDMKDVSEMPIVGEPLFMAFGAAIEATPVMTAQDLQKGLGSLAAAAR